MMMQKHVSGENEVEKWLKRIEEAFSGPSQIIGESLIPLINLEQQCEANLIKKFQGQDVILNAFEGFYFDTLRFVAKLLQSRKSSSQTFAIKIAVHVVGFRRFRASHILFLKGYPFDASSLLRGLFENVLDLTALEHKIVNISDLFGAAVSSEEGKTLTDREQIKKIKENASAVQSKINRMLIGSDSGLSSKTVGEMEVWRYLLHNAVHKSLLAMFSQCGQWLQGKSALPLFQVVDDNQAAFYMNRSTEIAWMLLRTFPLMQTLPDEFGAEWGNKWKILDGSFRQAVLSLQKDISVAICEFVDKKLIF